MSGTSTERGQYAEVDNTTIDSAFHSIGPKLTHVHRKSRKSRKAPLIILLALASGIILSLAHHLVYAYLDGKLVDNVVVTQAWIFRLSTACAFLVKLSLTVSVGAAFVQHQWMRFRMRPVELMEVDTVTAVLGNALSFFSLSLWLRHPLLTGVAIVSWVLPLTAVIAPGSLTVHAISNATIHELQVPQIQFSSNGFGIEGGGPDWGQLSSSSSIRRLAYAAASSWQPVSVPSAFQNQSYSLEFIGPGVKCSAANQTLIRNVTLSYGTSVTWEISSTIFGSWVGGDQQAMGLGQTGSDFLTLDKTSSDGARIYIMTNTGHTPYRNITSPSGYATFLVNLTECVLYNATYQVSFDFAFPYQTRQVSISDWLNPVSTATTPSHEPFIGVNLAYALMMDTFGGLLVGRSDWDGRRGGNWTIATSFDIINIDWSNWTAVQSGLEQLFQNFTLSLMSEPSLIKNSSLADYVPVTVYTAPNTYVYDSFDLLLAYGVGILSTILCAIVGLHAFIVNDASYQNTFSTFLRATKDEDFQAVREPHDSGADPLPSALKKIKFTFGE